MRFDAHCVLFYVEQKRISLHLCLIPKVSESLELTSFMEKIKSQDNVDTSEELKELAVQDWVIKIFLLINATAF